MDNIERLLDYGAIGPRYSNVVLQALLVLLTKQPPKGRKLLVFCTTSRRLDNLAKLIRRIEYIKLLYFFQTFTFRQVLEEMEMLSTFTAVLRVPNISQCEQLVAVLEETDAFSKSQIAAIARKVANRR